MQMQTRFLQLSSLLDIDNIFFLFENLDGPFNDSKLTNSILNPYPIQSA